MRWLSSSGGPLVLVPRPSLAAWKGSQGDASDYKLVCSVRDYAGVVRWRSIDLLVLGDEPLQTAARIDRDRVILLRWMYAPDEDGILKCLDLEDWGSPVESLPWVAQEPEHMLVDAALAGSAVQESIPLHLNPGSYRITTHVVKPQPDVGAVIHSLSPGP